MKNFCTYLLRGTLIPCILLAGVLSAEAETNPKYYAVEVSAAVQAAPPQITLKWAVDPNASGYSVYRKAPAASSWTLLTALNGSATTWTDVSVANGTSYEYQITKSTSVGYQGTGYILAGINAPMIDNRGKVVLIVDNTYAAALSTELARLQQDLAGDGWTVLRHDVSRNDSVVTVKNLIKADYKADPANVQSVFLFGHVPVPYSGDLNPDGHPDHKGAWPADVYYGDMDGTWTDSSVNDTSGGTQRTWNVPGDGKFDQSTLPSDVELQVGRVDLANMTCYANKTPARSELDLLRAYLNKDHSFRTGQVVLPRRGLICDNFGEHSGEAFASSGWRNFAPFFGADNDTQVAYGTYFSTLKDNGYLCSYGTGGGSYYTCDGIGSSDDFATTDIKTVFTMFLGSYFGDWDNESAFLRAPLGSGDCLASAWAGRPHWFFHYMGLGETIGYGAKLSQNNNNGGIYSPQNFGTHGVHLALMGDPTLRLHPVIPPSNLTAASGAGVTVTWSASSDANIQGYVVYRAGSVNGPFTRISGSGLLNALSFGDPSGAAGTVYMVRAVKLEESGSGTYYNPSVGVTVTASGASGSGGGVPVPTAPAAPSNLSGTAGSSSQVNLAWTDNSSNESGFTLMRKAGANGTYNSIALGANVTAYSDSGLSAGTQYYYKVCAWNSVGNSAYSVEISVTTPSAPTQGAGAAAAFVQDDSSTAGLWKGKYGGDGAVVIGDSSSLPSYVSVSYSAERQGWVWADPALDAGSLQRGASSARIAACYYSPAEFSTTLHFSDSQTHRVAFYFLDWDNLGRQQTVQVYDADSGALLVSRAYFGFNHGLYSTWDLKGNVRVRLVHTAGANCVLSGIFFAATGGSTPAPDPTPTPTPTPSAGSQVRYLGLNSTTQGTWKGVFGTQGYQVMEEGASLPAFAQVSVSGKSDWVWAWNTTDNAAIQKATSADRVAGCYYASSSFDMNINITDGQTHKVSFYCLDWDLQNRTQRIDVLDGSTGAVLQSVSLAGFQKGQYVSYDVKGSVVFRFTRTGPLNSVISGLFFDPASAPL